MSVSILRCRGGVGLPAGAYLDANFLLHCRDVLSPKYQSATHCLGELVRQRVELNISALVIDELWWGLFKLSYRQLTGQELTGQEYKHHVEFWRANWPRIRQITAEILEWDRLTVLESARSAELVRDASDLRSLAVGSRNSRTSSGRRKLEEAPVSKRHSTSFFRRRPTNGSLFLIKAMFFQSQFKFSRPTFNVKLCR